jgi:hypothetical protein
MVEIINELKALLESNAVLSTLNIGVITTAIGTVGVILKNAKTKLTTLTNTIQNTVSAKVDSVKNDTVSTVANLHKELDILKTQNDIQVKLLSTVIKHAKWNADAVPELAKTISEYNQLSIKTVDKIGAKVEEELHDLSKELQTLAAKPVVEEQSLVGQLFDDK